MSPENSLQLEPHATFGGRTGPVLIVVADGIGVAPDGPSNAVSEAETPTLDALSSSSMATTLAAHGTAVGLPTEGDMGNSEVGHNALGAGRIFAQGAKLVNEALESKNIFASEAWKEAVSRTTVDSGPGGINTLHFLGLHSDGNVHSHNNHLYELMRQAAVEGVRSIRVHILHDGRDVGARSALNYIAATEAVLAELNEQYNSESDALFAIASGGGRMAITMDRYEADWGMVKRGYDCHTHGIGRQFGSATEAVETAYKEADAEGKNTGDQYLDEFVVVDDDGHPVGKMTDGDAVIMYNFRGDRAIEISKAYERADFDAFDRGEHPDVTYAGMLQYDGDELVPAKYLVAPPDIDRTMGEFLAASGKRTFAISETQKFGHVTFFWNGNRSGYIDEQLETYVEIPSDNVEFNTTPGMKLEEITDKTIELLRSGDYDHGRINYPNGDMVGHTGDLPATIEAVEILDACMKRLIDVIDEVGGVLIYTADHGNADIMYTEKNGVRTPKTSHTISPVPFSIYDAKYDGDYKLDPPEDAGLSHVAATTLNLLGFKAPDDYRPSLIEFTKTSDARSVSDPGSGS